MRPFSNDYINLYYLRRPGSRCNICDWGLVRRKLSLRCWNWRSADGLLKAERLKYKGLENVFWELLEPTSSSKLLLFVVAPDGEELALCRLATSSEFRWFPEVPTIGCRSFPQLHELGVSPGNQYFGLRFI